MARQRSHSVAFKRQVAQEFLAGESLHALSKRHDISRQLIRVWVERYEAGALDEDAQAADVTAGLPAVLLQRTLKSRGFDTPLGIVLGLVHEHTNPPHPLGLLRSRRERPRGRRRTAEQRNELASPCMTQKEHVEG